MRRLAGAAPATPPAHDCYHAAVLPIQQHHGALLPPPVLALLREDAAARPPVVECSHVAALRRLLRANLAATTAPLQPCLHLYLTQLYVSLLLYS